MHFPILLYNVSVHHRKNSSGMPLSPLDSLKAFKTTPLPWRYPWTWGKENVTQSKTRGTGRLFKFGDVFLCQKLPVAQRTQSHYLFRHLQIFGDNLSYAVLFHVQLTCDPLKSQSTIFHTPPALPVLFAESLPLLESSFTSSWRFLNLLCHWKTHVRDMVLFPYTCWIISSICDGVFSKSDKRFQVYSFLSANSWTAWKRGWCKSAYRR